MSDIFVQLLSLLGIIVFLTSVIMHTVRRNSSLLLLYLVQSVAVVIMLLIVGLEHMSMSLFFIALVTFLVKVAAAGTFFSKLIDRKHVQASAVTYLNLPLTLVVILSLTMLIKSSIFAPIISLFPNDTQIITLALSGIFISLFLVINRRGIFSQLIGILSFENGLVVFGIIAGVEQTFAIELGILFDILLWMFISSVLVSLVYSHFGSLDTEKMRKLKD